MEAKKEAGGWTHFSYNNNIFMLQVNAGSTQKRFELSLGAPAINSKS